MTGSDELFLPGDAFIQLPITSDYVSAKMFLSSISPSMVPTQGTAIGAAINLALRSFSPNEGTEKTMGLITDLENHEDDALRATKAAFEKCVTINVLGIGSIPVMPDSHSGNQRISAGQ